MRLFVFALFLLPAGGPVQAAGQIPNSPSFRLEPARAAEAAALADCPADPSRRHGQDWFSGSGLWRVVITRDLASADGPLVLALDYPFKARFRIVRPNAAAPAVRATHGPGRDPRWPARLSVVTLGNRVAAGQTIELCADPSLGRAVEVRILAESTLRALTRREDLAHAAVLGMLFAMAVAGIGMTLAIGNATFLLLSTGLFGALLYLTATRGTVHELPVLAGVPEHWALHKLGGTLAVLAFGAGLSRLVALGRRHPRIAMILHGVLALVGALLLLLLWPAASRAGWTALAGNLLLLAVTGLLSGTAAIDALKGHRPSRVLLLAWSPPFLVASWLAVEVMTGVQVNDSIELLFPATLAIASAVMFFGLADDISQVRLQRDSAEQRADHDDLTGTLARGAFDRALEALRRRSLNFRHPLAVLFIDIDHFKRVNDECGHQAGDRTLVQVVNSVTTCLRDRDPLGRYGGEEFLVGLEDVSAREATRIAERIRAGIENGGEPLAAGLPPVTVSIGVAMLDQTSSEPVRALIERADSALRWCKSSGRNRVRMHPGANREMELSDAK